MERAANVLGPTAGIIVIGEEILSAKVDEANARHLLHELRDLGVAVRRIEVIPDDLDEIVTAVRAMSARFDHVFTSGGIGPTHDDVTMPAVAAAFGMALVRHPGLEALLRQAMGASLHDRDLRMADVPDGGRLLPGVGEGWPVVAVHNVYVLPGVPSFFRRKFDAIREMFRAGPIHARAVYSREGEGGIAAALDAVVAQFPTVVIGSYPRVDAPDHKVKITLDGRDAAAVERASEALVARLGAAVVRRE